MEKTLNPFIASISTVPTGPIDTFAYDSLSDSIIFTADNQLKIKQMASDTLQTFSIPKLETHPGGSNTENKGLIQDARLRFIPSNADSKMAVTHFGNVLTSYSKKPQVAITNYGLSQGAHYWEILCPNKCTGIEFGVVKAGWNLPETQDLKNDYIFFDFNTSTSRTVCLSLDFEAREISAWIKSNETKIKKAQITQDIWYPCIRINEIGNVAIFNTRTAKVDLENAGKHFTKHQVKKALRCCLLTLPSISLTQIEAHYFSSEQELDQFKESLRIEETRIIDQNLVSQWGYQISKNQDIETINSDDDEKKALDWLRNNFVSVVQSPKIKEAEIERFNIQIQQSLNAILDETQKPQKPKSFSDTNLRIEYLKSSDCLLVSDNHQMKLVNKSNGEFNMNEIFSFNRPQTPRDPIQLYLEIKPLKLLLQILKSNFTENLGYSAMLGLEELFNAIQASIAHDQIYSDYLLVNIIYKNAKYAVNTIVDFLEKSTEQGLNNLLSFVSAIDEALYAMIHHEDATDSLFAYWQGTKPRTFTSFNRIETLSFLPDSQFNLAKLADLGLFNSSYINSDSIQLYQDPELPIDFERVTKGGPLEVEALIQEHINESAKNVPLNITLNNLPPQINDNTLLTSNETFYLAGVSNDGQVEIWNSNKALVFLSKSNFTQSLQEKKPNLFKPKKEKSNLSTAPLAANPFGNEAFGGFGGLGGPNVSSMALAATANQNLFQEPEELDEDDEDTQVTTKTNSKKKSSNYHSSYYHHPSSSFIWIWPNPLKSWTLLQ